LSGRKDGGDITQGGEAAEDAAHLMQRDADGAGGFRIYGI
jgi:hypothetical protein